MMYLKCLYFLKKVFVGDFPCGPVVENSPPNAEDMGVIIDWGNKTPHATGQLSLLAAMRESSHTTTKSLNRQNRRKKMYV